MTRFFLSLSSCGALAGALVTGLGLTAPVLAQDTSTDPTQQAAPAPAPSMQEIEDAWRAGDFVFVRSGLQQLAETTGTALAQYRYGRLLAEGRGGPTDLTGAVTWLTRAVEQNHAEAMTLLARIYLSAASEDQDQPTALSRDPETAAGLLTRAAALGDAEGQYYLAMLYMSGDGVPQEDATAFTWMLAAARQEQTEAQYTLSRLYSAGTGTAANTEEALAWLLRAAENNHARAQYNLAALYETGRAVDQDLPTAISWYHRAAENGLPIAQRNLGTYYLQGEAIAQNVEEGLRWLTRAAQAGDASAMHNLGLAYAVGMGVAQDDATALRWYDQASEYGMGRSKVALGLFYENGRGVAADLDRAITLYEQALSTNDADKGALQLARLAATGALDGRIAPQRAIPWALYAAQFGDTAAEAWVVQQAEAGRRAAQAGLATLWLARDARVEEGAKWLQEAARNGDPGAQFQLGELHMTGTHVALDYVAAHKWFNIAATLGISDAADRRETVSALMTPEDVARAQSAARLWFETEEPQPPATQQTVTTVPE